MSLLTQVLDNIEKVVDNADSTGCSEDLTVTNYWAVDRLKEMLPAFREFVLAWERTQPKEESEVLDGLCKTIGRIENNKK